MRYLIYLFVITLILCLTNYKPDTFLSGWDTLHPEFNFGEYFKRSFFSVWQEHQGLGAVASQSHAGELPRLFIYYLSSLVLPDSLLRWGYFFLCLILGPIGVFFLLKYITGKAWVGFCAGLVYLLNLGTLQHFYLPLEMFATHFATLPYLFLFGLKFLDWGKIKDLIIFSIFTLLSTPASHTPTLFYVYFLSLFIFLITNIIIDRKRLLRAILILIATLMINSFWLLPNIYFVLNHGKDVVESKIHTQLFNRAFYTSKEFATIADASLIRGFLFDWGKFDFDQHNFVDLFEEWKRHLANPFVKILGYLTFVMVILGIIASFVKKNIAGFAFLPIFILAFFAIAQDFDFLSSIDVIRESLRFHFTKFSILLMFVFSIFFGLALNFIKPKKWVPVIVSSTVAVSLIFYMLPAFTGNLINKGEKVKFPKEYSLAFDYLNSKEKVRIANFPIHTFWGWGYYKWDYEGAGFTWFGLKSPILDREFDRWFPYNENYYWEVSYALYSQNLNLLEHVLEKYQVGYLWIDESIFDPSSTKSLYTDELKNMLSSSSKIQKDAEFGAIKIYKVNLSAPINEYVFLAKDLPKVGPEYKWSSFDQGYIERGNYSVALYPDIYYPFRSLFTGRAQEDLEFSVSEDGDSFLFKKDLPEDFQGYFLQIPEINSQDLQWVDPADLRRVEALTRDVFFDGKQIIVKVPKVGGFYSAQIESEGRREFLLPNLPHNLSYLIKVENSNSLGKPLNFWIENFNSRRADIETYLPRLKTSNSYFIQPPMEKDGLGYALHFDETKFGNDQFKNELGKIDIQPIPFNFLSSLSLKKENVLLNPKLSAVKVNHPNQSAYFVEISEIEELDSKNSILVLSQAFEKGWKAYEINNSWLQKQFPFLGREIKTHVLVNNWQNGWSLDNFDANNKIAIIFMPQYLQYAGMFLILAWAILLIIKVMLSRWPRH